jgi:hypothetical protein
VTPRLSVIIVNYNGREDLSACLRALLNQTVPVEIIVVDNLSTDGSADLIRTAFPEVVLVEPGENTYFCRGNNIGLDHAHGEYALLLNPDTVAPTDMAEALITFMDSHPDHAGATLQLRYPEGGIQRTCSRIASFQYLLLTQTVLRLLLVKAARRSEARHYYQDDGWDRTSDRDVEAIPGSCTLMRRADLHLSEALLLYFNEDDLARRFAGRRFRFLCSPAIEHREKSVTRSAHASRLYFRDLVVYTRLHHGTLQAAMIWLLSRPLAWGVTLRWRFGRHSPA